MSAYVFHIKKADHVGDLHVHIFYNEGHSRKSLGCYRLPDFEPLFPKYPKLTKREETAIKEWLSQPVQQHKLEACLKDTLFDIHKLARDIPEFSNIVTDKPGEVFINIRIPISRRIVM